MVQLWKSKCKDRVFGQSIISPIHLHSACITYFHFFVPFGDPLVTLLQETYQSGHVQFGFLRASLASSPYRFLRQTPQYWPWSPRHLPDLQMVFMSKVFWRHWWQVVPLTVSYILVREISMTFSSIWVEIWSAVRKPLLGFLILLVGWDCLRVLEATQFSSKTGLLLARLSLTPKVFSKFVCE